MKALVKEYPYYDDIDAFIFGPEEDDDGYQRIGKGAVCSGYDNT